jgi:hypothetical protein
MLIERVGLIYIFSQEKARSKSAKFHEDENKIEFERHAGRILAYIDNIPLYAGYCTVQRKDLNRPKEAELDQRHFLFDF